MIDIFEVKKAIMDGELKVVFRKANNDGTLKYILLEDVETKERAWIGEWEQNG